MDRNQSFDVIIVGAGAAGLMAAMACGKRGRSVLILEKSKRPGRKILMAGGGFCNFTNYRIEPHCFLSHNKHFCKSALKQYTQWDFIELVNKHGIAFHEKTKGQLFCNTKEGQILKLLLDECRQKTITSKLGVGVERVEKINHRVYQLVTTQGKFTCESLIVATGGLSIPSMGSSPWGYQIAEQFGLKVHPLRAGLVPLTLHDQDKARLSPLSGVSFDTEVHCYDQSFCERTLMTHRGLSGPAILQISSYWHAGESITINCLPSMNIADDLNNQNSKQSVKAYLSQYLPKRFLDVHMPDDLLKKSLYQLQKKERYTLADHIHRWVIKPNGTEGYRTAEVTLGGVDCCDVSSKTMESHVHKGLYFVGEVLDVTGWLGGYNFQWAWSSGFVAGQYA